MSERSGRGRKVAGGVLPQPRLRRLGCHGRAEFAAAPNPRLISPSSDEDFPFPYQPIFPVSKKPTATAEPKGEDGVKSAAFRDAPINASLTREKKVELYRTMVRIRR